MSRNKKGLTEWIDMSQCDSFLALVSFHIISCMQPILHAKVWNVLVSLFDNHLLK